MAALAQSPPAPTTNGGGAFQPQVTVSDAPQALPAATTAAPEQSRAGLVYLLKARQALARGDVQAARQMTAECRQQGVLPADAIDTPDLVDQLIARQSELAQMARGGDADQYNYQAAVFLLQQADSLVSYHDYVTAEALVLRAKSFPTTYKSSDLTPDVVMQRLNTSRGSAAVAHTNYAAAQAEAMRLVSQAQLALDQGRLTEAQQLVNRVKGMELPDTTFDGANLTPWAIELAIREAATRAPATMQADYETPTNEQNVASAKFVPDTDTTRNVQASSTEATNNAAQPLPETATTEAAARAKQLVDSGMAALAADDEPSALQYFRMAWQYQSDLDPATRQMVQERMAQLQDIPNPPAAGSAQELTPPASDAEMVARQKVQSEIFRQRAVAARLLEQRDPRGALAQLNELRAYVEGAELDDAARRQMMALVDREIRDMEHFIEVNLAQIEADEANTAAREEIFGDMAERDARETKVKELIDQFNELVDQHRYAEAQVIARQAINLAPEMEVVAMLEWKANFLMRMVEQEGLAGDKERLVYESLTRLEEDSRPFDESMPLQWNPNATDWAEMSKVRRDRFGDQRYVSETERRIWSALAKTIQMKFDRTPLSEVISIMAANAGENIVFDTRALELENVSLDAPVTMDIQAPISIESALRLVLDDYNLVFVIENEVIKITNKAIQQRDLKRHTYYVGDLIVPVPNFDSGLAMKFFTPMGSMMAMKSQGIVSGDQTMPLTVSQDQPTSTSQLALAQQFGMPNNPLGGLVMDGSPYPQTGMPIYNEYGAPGLGGGITEDDFEDLIELIEETIEPDSWETNGGTGRMRAFPSNLSLIVTNTQEIQDQIQDLLKRLRELNDVQIVIEVRFITLTDDFFERVGLDFDFRIEDHSNYQGQDIVNESSVIGRAPLSNVFAATEDGDVTFRQDSFASAVPQVGGFDANTAANFGFAILSDIEAWFLIQAAKGAERNNITQAPTVTLFNGQVASVQDQTITPFVTSITPVVGDFAAAQQPIITILPEGTQLNVQAVASPDRRFVRMTLIPFFSQIQDVQEFKFEGSRTVRRDSRTTLEDILDALDGDTDGDGSNDDVGDEEDFTIIDEGTTVQLPVFAFTTVSTSVSVPDGGTILIGGIKRQSEQRVERGVPFLSNIPYINRLFKNVGIGRESESLMMMVTPTIIIQEEEESFQVGQVGQ
jgi:general secretion pathway protein D